MEGFTLAHLPIVREYAHRMGFIEIVNGALINGMHTGPGTVLLSLVMNLLSGRSPLYRVEEFFSARDVPLLLGEGITPEKLNDDAIGRVLDCVYEYGTWKIFSEVCVQAFRNFSVDCSVVHQDTTSVSLWGEYAPEPGDPVHITYGFSKDKRPDLKQFIFSLLCVEGNLPVHGGILDGNTSDKKTNGGIIAELPQIMSRHGVEDIIYVADSALVTEENLSLMGDGISFVSRFPENFTACRSLISKAVAVGNWQDAGHLSQRTAKGMNVCARYRLREEQIELYGRTYRALVVHSDAHDRGRQKRIDCTVRRDAIAVHRKIKELVRKEFFCLPDAQAATRALKDSSFHRLSFSFENRPVYHRGRPDKNGVRRIKEIRHQVSAQVNENCEAIEGLREEAGCFVLLTTVPAEKKSGVEILRIYKEQDGIERNFAFLKDPLFVNDVFLKKPHRIEAMGLVLVLSLLLWRLMERTMRRKSKENKIVLTGWNNRHTDKPTSFMMVSKFSSLFVGVENGRRFLFTPLNKVQLAYLNALDVSPKVFTDAHAVGHNRRPRSPC
jgi:transposase